ncbi:MAG TPA: MgtC/SapB family protein [Syntrophomonadaceae bacterium]|nr:MgtC/SapB family protein [Syntrophomonadaceae bacterium]
MGSIIIRLLISAIVGLAIGLIFKDKNTSRVFALICVGASLVTIISVEFFRLTDMPWHSDPGRLAAQIISALGFIGAGFIWVFEGKHIRGLSQSAALWYTAIIGMVIGVGITSTTIAVIIFAFILGIVGINITRKWE